MSGDFQVVISDLQTMSRTFSTESTTLTGVMPEDGPTPPSCGGDGADEALQAALGAIGALHMQLASVIDGHSTKLQAAHDNYDHADTSLSDLIKEIGVPD